MASRAGREAENTEAEELIRWPLALSLYPSCPSCLFASLLFVPLLSLLFLLLHFLFTQVHEYKTYLMGTDD